jgi:hypothetical protein
MPAARLLLPAVVALTLAAWPVRLAGDEAATEADEAKLQAAGLKTDGPALLDFFRRRTLTEAQRGQLADTVRRLGDDSFQVRERASADLVAAGRTALPFLKAVVGENDLEVARRAERCLHVIEGGEAAALTAAAVRLLAVRKPLRAAEVLLAYLPFAADEAIEEEALATLGVLGVRDGKTDPLLPRALKDPEPARRAAAALLVARSPEAGERAAVRKLLADRDVKVRLRAAQGLVAARDKEAVPTLVALLGEAPPAVAWQAEELLSRIAGDKAPAASLGAGREAERRKAHKAWDDWWREHGAKVDLTKVELEQRPLGLTLLVAYDGYSGNGKVWEVYADGKPRWEVTNVQGPIDAQVLPGSRVLIAEHGARRVSERDLHGKVLWEQRVGNSPVVCQRLPGGNTFIATYSEVLEVTPGHNQVFSYTSRQGMIFSAQKLRNGHLVYVTVNGLLVELDEKGKEVKLVPFGQANGWVTVEALPRGHFLIPLQTAGKVVELDGDGKVVWECASPQPNAATRLVNGHVLVCSNNDRSVRELDQAGKVVWEQRLEGRPFRVRRR